MNHKNYFEDGRLDVLILGPMGPKNQQVSSTMAIGTAINHLLAEERAQKLLSNSGTTQYEVHIPEDWDSPEIIANVLSKIDVADLVIVNLTPKEGVNERPSPNVFYELGLIHSLGLPVILIQQTGTSREFYFRSYQIYNVDDLRNTTSIADALRQPLQRFLNIEDDTDFTSNRISSYYGNMPIVDISAAVGLATGYYYNFVGRLLKDGLFITTYPEKVKRLIIVRPDNVLNTFSEDKAKMEKVLSDAGFTLTVEQLKEPPSSDKKGPVWIDHVQGIVCDLPRTIYPLKISPKLLNLRERLDKQRRSPHLRKQNELILKQTSEILLDRVEHAIWYHVNKEGDSYRQKLLQFARIEELPDLLRGFLNNNNP